jgi:hypothetical protein
MPLSLFCDALPYSEMSVQYKDWFDKLQLAPLMPNIAYSSSLHWQLGQFTRNYTQTTKRGLLTTNKG